MIEPGDALAFDRRFKTRHVLRKAKRGEKPVAFAQHPLISELAMLLGPSIGIPARFLIGPKVRGGRCVLDTK